MTERESKVETRLYRSVEDYAQHFFPNPAPKAASNVPNPKTLGARIAREVLAQVLDAPTSSRSAP